MLSLPVSELEGSGLDLYSVDRPLCGGHGGHRTPRDDGSHGGSHAATAAAHGGSPARKEGYFRERLPR